MSYFYHIPPSAAPIYLRDIFNGLIGFFQIKDYLHKFRKELEEYFQTKNVFLVSSGRAALTAILQALSRIDGNINKNEVIIPAYTCYSVPAAVIKAGFKVKLCDIDPNTLDFDYSLLKDEITEQTLAVVPCNLFGIPSDIERLKQVVTGSEIFIVDDAAQAMGASIDNKLAGSRGDLGLFSLDRGKNFTTVEGGIIITNRDDVAEEIKKILHNIEEYNKISQFLLLIKAMIISILIRPYLYWIPANLPVLGLGETRYSTQFEIRRMSNVQGGLAWNWLNKLKIFNEIRKRNAAYYRQTFSRLNKFKILEKSEATYHRYPISLRIEEVNMDGATRLGISKMYPGSIDHIPDFKSQQENSYPVATEVSRKLFCLPTHPYLNKSSRQKLVQQLQKVEESCKGTN